MPLNRKLLPSEQRQFLTVDEAQFLKDKAGLKLGFSPQTGERFLLIKLPEIVYSKLQSRQEIPFYAEFPDSFSKDTILKLLISFRDLLNLAISQMQSES